MMMDARNIGYGNPLLNSAGFWTSCVEASLGYQGPEMAKNIPSLRIQSPKLRMVMEPKSYAEKVIGHPTFIIWEYDDWCLGQWDLTLTQPFRTIHLHHLSRFCQSRSQFLDYLNLIYYNGEIFPKKRARGINEPSMERLLHLQNLFQSLGFKIGWVNMKMVHVTSHNR